MGNKLLFALAVLLLCLAPDATWAAGSVKYLDAYGQEQNSPPDITPLASAGTASLGAAGATTWRYVSGQVNYTGRLSIRGDVHVILTDGSHLNAQRGIQVLSNDSLTIYAQSTDSNTMGKLTATAGGLGRAGIGGDGNNNGNGHACGSITINGGHITATGSNGNNMDGYAVTGGGAGIGGGGGTGNGGDGGSIVINGGIVNATGGSAVGTNSGDKNGGAGIGGGGSGGVGNNGAGAGGNIVISGDADVKATGGNGGANANGGAGIGAGGGTEGNNGNIKIDTTGDVEITGGSGGTRQTVIITIYTHPSTAVTVTEGNISGSLSVIASVTPNRELSWQWYFATTNNTNTLAGTEIDGAMGKNFTIPTNLTVGTYYFYCVVSADDTNLNSNVATVTVNKPAGNNLHPDDPGDATPALDDPDEPHGGCNAIGANAGVGLFGTTLLGAIWLLRRKR